eukprot:s2238_g11.t1
MQALLVATFSRVLPAASFGMEVVVHVAGYDKLLNSLQATWMGKVLGCIAVPRTVMMHELGITLRFSALALVRASGLRRRAWVDPRYVQEKENRQCAQHEPSTWIAAVVSMEHTLGLPCVPDELCCDSLSTAQRKAKLHHHIVAVVQPAILRYEIATWASLHKNAQHQAAINPLHWTVAQVAQLDVSISDCQAWAQLKLQGFFSVGKANSPGARGSSAFCNKPELETVDHLFFDCSLVHNMLNTLLASADSQTRRRVGANCVAAADVLKWVRAAGKLWKRSAHAAP